MLIDGLLRLEKRSDEGLEYFTVGIFIDNYL